MERRAWPLSHAQGVGHTDFMGELPPDASQRRPARIDLWQAVLLAARELHGAGLALERDGKSLVRVSVPRFKTNDQGWPSVLADDEIFPRSGPIDWTRLVGLEPSTWTSLPIDELPRLLDVVALVEADEFLCSRISPMAAGGGRLRRAHLVDDCARLVGSILGRGIATNRHGDSDLMEFYFQREQALLAKSLSGDLLAPIALVKFPDIERVHLGNGVYLERLDEETQRARAVSLRSSVNPFLVAAATHAIVVESTEFDNPNWLVRAFRTWERELDLSRIDRACQAIEIVTGVPIGFVQVCVRPRGWADGWQHDLPPLEQAQIVERYARRFRGTSWNEAGPSIEAAELTSLSPVFVNLEAADRKVQLAARRLFQCQAREDDDDVVIDACIGIEALVGEGRDELTHRMASRAAVALARGAQRADAARVYALVKKVYAERSTIVHGGARKSVRIDFDGNSYGTSGLAVVLLRLLLFSALEGKPSWTPASLDAAMLQAVNALPESTERLGSGMPGASGA